MPPGWQVSQLQREFVSRRECAEGREDESEMIIRASDTEEKGGRRPYSLEGMNVQVQHFVIRVTTPGHPFRPHSHEQPELWFIIDGEALVSLDGEEHIVAARDLIAIPPWAEHGLRVLDRAEWICLG